MCLQKTHSFHVVKHIEAVRQSLLLSLLLLYSKHFMQFDLSERLMRSSWPRESYARGGSVSGKEDVLRVESVFLFLGKEHPAHLLWGKGLCHSV